MKPYTTPSKIFTTTLSLKLPKDSKLHQAMGDIDELIAVLNLCLSEAEKESHRKELERAINNLASLLGGLAMATYRGDKLPQSLAPKFNEIETKLANEEERLQKLNKELWGERQLMEFKYIFRNRFSIYLNWARTVTRRAERKLISASKEYSIPNSFNGFLNRLSDTLFILSIITDGEA